VFHTADEQTTVLLLLTKLITLACQQSSIQVTSRHRYVMKLHQIWKLHRTHISAVTISICVEMEQKNFHHLLAWFCHYLTTTVSIRLC